MVIGVLWESNSNANYRAVDPLRALERRGHEIVWPTTGDGEGTARALMRCDAVHVYRRYDRETRALMERLRAHGIGVTWDTDDDLSELPRESPLYKQNGGIAAKRLHAEMLKIARVVSVVTTTTEVLAARYRRVGLESVEVIGNQIGSASKRPRGRRHDGVVVGWIAAMEHNAEAKRLKLGPLLERLQAAHPQLHVECIGVDLRLKERYRHDGLVDFRDLPERMADFDVGLAPLVDIPFNHARSDIKVKEYAASRVPWLASPIGPYADLGEEQGGRLVADDDWYEALERLITQPRERRKLARKGRSWAKRQTIETAAERWEAVFRAASAESRRPAYDSSLSASR